MVACGLGLPATLRITADERRMSEENSVNGHDEEEAFHFDAAAVCLTLYPRTQTQTHTN